MPLQWFLKYRPKSLDEVENQEDVKKELRAWIESWLNGKPTAKAVLLYGPPGTGKTTLAEALARDYKLELLEINASDSRKLSDIKNIAERASLSGSLFGIRGKLILLDEMDGINAKADVGIIDAVLELIDRTRQPIILTANDPWDPQLRPIREKVKMIEVPRLTKYPLKRILKRICEGEKIMCEDEALDEIIELSEGDARYAINMLQGVAEGYGKVTVNMVKALGRRKDRELDPFEALRSMFWSRYFWQAKNAVTNTQIDYELLMRWIDENIPNQYENMEDIYRAYDALARASLFLTRAKLVGWDLLSYVFDLMGPGVSFAEKAKFSGAYKAKWKKYQFPSYIQMLAKSKDTREKLRTILSKLGNEIHASQEKALNEMLPFFVQIYRSPKFREALKKELEITPSEEEVIQALANLYEGAGVKEVKEGAEEAEEKKTTQTKERRYYRGRYWKK